MKTCIVYLHAITPVHSGTGQAVAVIDLPIAREKSTGWPIIPGSSIKGVFKDAYSGGDDEKGRLFGTPDSAGQVVFTDQRILCLPVRSFFGTFAYVTSPLVLRRFKEDFQALGASIPFDAPVPEITGEASCKVTNNAVITRGGKVYLEDLDVSAEPADAVTPIAGGLAKALFAGSGEAQRQFQERFAIASDELFNFLSESATEIVARIRLDPKTGTTSTGEGNLWYEEALPSETLFAGAALCTNGDEPQRVLEVLNGKFIQVGGDASVGRGLCRVIVQ